MTTKCRGAMRACSAVLGLQSVHPALSCPSRVAWLAR